jgi:hypothetical protein
VVGIKSKGQRGTNKKKSKNVIYYVLFLTSLAVYFVMSVAYNLIKVTSYKRNLYATSYLSWDTSSSMSQRSTVR